jgi:DNA-binding MarR family transcriptional regulator
MASPPNTDFATITFGAAVLKIILDNPLPNETASHRVKQLGIMSIIYYMQSMGLETTGPALVAKTGVSRATLSLIVAPLIKRNLLKEEMKLNSIGEGRVAVYSIHEHLVPSVSLTKHSPPGVTEEG